MLCSGGTTPASSRCVANVALRGLADRLFPPREQFYIVLQTIDYQPCIFEAHNHTHPGFTVSVLFNSGEVKWTERGDIHQEART